MFTASVKFRMVFIPKVFRRFTGTVILMCPRRPGSGSSFCRASTASAMTADKKRHGDAITLVVPRDVGECVLYELAADELGDFIKAGLK